MLLRGQIYTHIIATLSYNNARQVSAITVYPPSKASSCELNNRNKNMEVEKKIDYIYPCPFSL
jgi:hypothetical protein